MHIAPPMVQGLFLFCLVLLISACDGNYLVWSSDGKLGAAVGAKGLRICDGEGSISKIVVDKAGMFRWIPQEHQGLYVGYDYVSRWSDLKQLLSAEQEKLIVDESTKLRRKLFTYRGDPKKFAENALRTFNYPLEAAIHLHHLAAPDVEKVAATKWPAYSAIKVPVFFIKLIQVDAQSATQMRTVDRGIDEVVELRVSPNGKYIACVKHQNGQERNYLVVIPNVAFSKPIYVAANTNCYPDWSSDSRFLYYSRGNTDDEPDFLKGQNIHEGSLFKVEVIDTAGKTIAPLKPQKLARLIFDNRAPVRTLKDGRVLFASREVRIPLGAGAILTNAVFGLDGSRAEVLFRKNDDVAFFEPNPEQDQLAVCTNGGALYVIKINGTDPVELCNGKDLRISGIFPQWKTNHELSYGTEQPAPKGSKPNYAVALWTRGAGVKDLSKAWGKEAASEVIAHRDIFQEAMSGVMDEIERKTGAKK